MPPIEFVTMRSRKHLCYVIEEEQDDDTELARCDSQLPNTFNNCKSVLSANGQHISKLCSKDEDIVTSCGNYEDHNESSELMDVSSSDSESDDFQASFNSSKLPDIYRRVNDLSKVASLSSTSSTNEQEHQWTYCRDSFLVKSGVLVLVTSDQGQRPQFKSKNCRSTTSTSSFPPRCPTIVKIHRKSFEKYVVVTSTRRHLITPSLFLKLKHSHVTQSLSNPSHFVIFIDGIVGQSFTFEASSPDLATQWVHALTVESSCSRMFSHYRELPYKPKALYPSHITDDDAALNDGSIQSWSTPCHALQDSPLLPVLSESIIEDDEEINR